MMNDRKAKQILVLFLSFVLVSVPLIQSAISSEPKTTKTGNVTQLWKFPVVGAVCNLPVVKDGFVYVTSSYVHTPTAYVYCLNASTGAIVWNYTTIDYIYWPLHVAEGITYKDTGRSRYPDVFYVLNATTGEEMWNLTETGGVPFIADGYLCLGNSCFNATTGAKIWEFPTELRRIRPFVVGDHAFINGYISKNDFSELIVYCLDVSTGTHLWNYTYTKMLLTVVDNHVFLWTTDLSNPDADVNNIIALDVFTGNKIWNYTVGGSVHTEIVEDSVYIGSDNTVYRVDSTTGAEKWNYQLDDYHVSDLVVVNSSVYVSYGERLQCLDASTGDTKWTRTDVDVDHGFYVFGDEVYFGTEGTRDRKSLPLDSTIYCLDAHTGTQIFNYTIEGDLFNMAMVDGILYVAADYPFTYIFLETGYVYALKPTIESIPESSSVYIRPDGSVEGTDKIQREGNVYTFSDNINAEITVEIDDIVIDGANYSLQGNGEGVGIHVPNNGNVEIRNIKIQDFKFAIYFDYYSKDSNTISGNTLTNNTHYGIHITNSHNNTISGNYIGDSGTGIQLVESYNNTISQNRIIGNAEGIGFGSGGGHSTVVHNLIADNGYAFTFWANSHNTIYENNLINNTNQVNAWSSSNNWDYDSKGNYWSNYNGTDENNDGIGDTPYVINTSPEDYGDADNYPLIEPVDDSLIPEFPSWTILPLVFTITLFSIVVKRKLCASSRK